VEAVVNLAGITQPINASKDFVLTPLSTLASVDQRVDRRDHAASLGRRPDGRQSGHPGTGARRAEAHDHAFRRRCASLRW
jgi:hypothetical protein